MTDHVDIGILVEGHAGLTWERWSRILRTAEVAGLASVFRSDHFFIGRERDSLEAFLSFAGRGNGDRAYSLRWTGLAGDISHAGGCRPDGSPA